MRTGRRSRWISNLLIGTILGAISLAPAFAHHQPKHTKKQIKQVRKSVKKTNATLGAEIADAATSFGPTSVALGQSATLITEGPFTVTGKCEDDGGDTEANVYIATTEEGSAFGATSNSSGSFGPSTPEGDRALQDGVAASSGDPDHSYGYDDQFSAIAPSGTAINGTVAAVANDGTGQCRYYGHHTTVA